MTIEELERLYAEIQVDPEAERRVIAAVSASDRGPSTRRWVPMLAVATVIAVLAVVLALRPGGSHPTPPAQPTSLPPTPSGTVAPKPSQAIIPAPREDAIDGAVLHNGRPLAGASLQFRAWPNSSVHLKKGQAVRQYLLGTAVTDEHGSFVLPVSVRTVPDKYLEGSRAQGGAINLQVDVATQEPGVGAFWFFPIDTTPSQHSKKSQLVFDLGRQTVRIDGKTQPLVS